MINISQKCNAFQSSFSKWSHDENESINPLFNKAPKGYSFHTSNNGWEWWIADTKYIYPINKLIIHKRTNFENNIQDKDIFIYTSKDLKYWEFVGHPLNNDIQDKFIIYLHNKKARFIKICVKDKYLYFNNIEILIDDLIIPFREIFLYKSKKIDQIIINTLINGTYEKNEIDIVLSNINKDDIVLELGASIGAMSTIVKNKFKEILYYACEANPELIPLIEKNHKLNNISCNIINGAVGKGDFIDFYIHKQCWSSSIVPFKDPLRIEKIKVYNLKELINIIKPTFLIIDIEGAEYEIFDEEIDLSNIRKICIEFHSSGNAENLFKLIQNKGFSSLYAFPNRNQFVMYFYKK